MRALSYEEDIEILEERLENYRNSLGKNSSRDTRMKLKIENMEHQLELFLKVKAFDEVCAVVDYNYPTEEDKEYARCYQNPRVPLKTICEIVESCRCKLF